MPAQSEANCECVLQPTGSVGIDHAKDIFCARDGLARHELPLDRFLTIRSVDLSHLDDVQRHLADVGPTDIQTLECRRHGTHFELGLSTFTRVLTTTTAGCRGFEAHAACCKRHAWSVEQVTHVARLVVVVALRELAIMRLSHDETTASRDKFSEPRELVAFTIVDVHHRDAGWHPLERDGARLSTPGTNQI